MVANQKRHGFAILRRHADAAHGRVGSLQRCFHVALISAGGVGMGLAGIVEQQREQQHGLLRQLQQELAIARRRGAGVLDGYQGVLVHGVAMVEIAHHLALDLLQAREQREKHAGLMHRADRQGRVGLGENLVQRGPQAPRLLEVLPQAAQTRLQLIHGFVRETQAVTRHEFEQPQHQFGVILQLLWRAKMNALAMHREIGVGEPRAPPHKLREQSARLRVPEFQGAHGRAIDGARLAVILAHPRGHVPVVGQGILGVEGELILVASCLGVECGPQARQVPEGVPQVVGRLGRGQTSGVRLAELLHPSDELKIAQPAGSLLHVGLEMIESVGVFGVALAGQADQVAHQGVAVALHEARKFLAQGAEQRPVAGQKALVQQADVELGVLVVNLQAFVGNAHRLADAQAGVPQSLQKGRDLRFMRAEHVFVPAQQEQVDIGERKKLAPPVSAHGNHRETFGNGGKQQLRGGLRHQMVHQAGAFGERNQDVGGCGEGMRRGIGMGP